MSKIALYSTIAGAGTVGAVVVAVVTGLIEWPANTPDAPVAVVQDTPQVTPAVTPDPKPEQEVAQDPVTAPVQAPKFDLVRAETDGSTLVAGVAEPGAEVEVLVDGEAVAMAPAGGDGKFVAFVDLPTKGEASVITLRTMQDNAQIVSVEEVIVAPVANDPAAPKPDVVAALDAPDGGDVAQETAPDADAVVDQAPEQGEATAVPVVSEETPVEVDTADPATTPVSEPEVTDVAVVDAPQETTPTQDPAAQPETAEAPTPAVESDAPDVGDVEVAAITPEISVETDPDVAQDTPVTVPETNAEDLPAEEIAAVQPAPSAGTTADVLTPSAAAGVAPLGEGMGDDPTISARNEPEGTTEPAQPRAPAVLISSPDGVEVLQTAPLSQGEVALDSISYDAAGEVLISGRGSESAYVRVYLDNAPVSTSQIKADGRWRIELPEVDTGTYTLRVDQVNEAGAVTARVESPFLRESPSVLEAARGEGQGPARSITVQPGNTLWGISRSRYGRGMAYVSVFEANKDRIRDPDLIYPGQIFDLPTEIAEAN